MGSRERRDRERTETRERILEAARAMFVEHGYEATTMRAIARQIEYTPTAIYHHFRDKESLFAELCAIDFRSLAAVFAGIDDDADPIERIEKLGEAYVDFGLRHPMHYQLMFMTRRPGGTADEADLDPGKDAYGFLLRACEEAVASERFRPEFTDPQQLAQILWSTCHGLVSLHIVKGDDDWLEWRDVRATSTLMRDAMLRGLLA